VSRSFYLLFLHHKLPEASQIGQHVSIEGQPGVYIVLRLDMKRFAADLMLTTGNHALEENISFSALQPVKSKNMQVSKETSRPVESKSAAAIS